MSGSIEGAGAMSGSIEGAEGVSVGAGSNVLQDEADIISRFKKVVAVTPDRPAVQEKGPTTFKELDRLSDELALHLQEAHSLCGQPIALLYRPGLQCYIAQIAVLKGRNHFANIDSEMLCEKQAMLLDNLETQLLLHDDACTGVAQRLSAMRPLLNLVNTERHPCPKTTVVKNGVARANDSACIVYTSGTTGMPQGVVLTHGNVLYLALQSGLEMQLGASDRAMQACQLWTGASVSEIFSALLNGVTLYPCSLKHDGAVRFLNILRAERITTFVAAPIMFRILMQAASRGETFASVRLVRLGGDRVTKQDVDLLKTHFASHCMLRVGYGSTELILVAQLYINREYSLEGASAAIPVGYAVGDVAISIIGESGEELPPNECGEIVVKSRFLSPGYFKNDALTRERFAGSSENSGQCRSYFTRDIGYKDVTGCLFHVGRSDSRVKMNGKFVNLLEIEMALLEVLGVRSAIVVPFDDEKQNVCLAAYVIVSGEAMGDKVLKGRMRSVLAPELVPHHVYVVDEFPVLSNGKVDRRRLKALASMCDQSDGHHRD